VFVTEKESFDRLPFLPCLDQAIQWIYIDVVAYVIWISYKRKANPKRRKRLKKSLEPLLPLSGSLSFWTVVSSFEVNENISGPDGDSCGPLLFWRSLLVDDFASKFKKALVLKPWPVLVRTLVQMKLQSPGF